MFLQTDDIIIQTKLTLTLTLTLTQDECRLLAGNSEIGRSSQLSLF